MTPLGCFNILIKAVRGVSSNFAVESVQVLSRRPPCQSNRPREGHPNLESLHCLHPTSSPSIEPPHYHNKQQENQPGPPAKLHPCHIYRTCRDMPPSLLPAQHSHTTVSTSSTEVSILRPHTREPSLSSAPSPHFRFSLTHPPLFQSATPPPSMHHAPPHG